MIKVQNNIATREPIPAFLSGLNAASLLDLSWTDPALGVQGCTWWPEEDKSPVLVEYERYGDETLTVDAANKRVVVTRAVVPWSAEEIATDKAAKAKALQEFVVAATQQRLDDFARTRNYDGILSLCTYATSAAPKFQAEGQYAVNARDITWVKLYEIMAEVEAGTRPVPAGFADIEPSLPVLAWPT